MKQMKEKKLAVLLLLFCTSMSQMLQANDIEKKSNPYSGLWLTDDAETIVKISQCKQSLCGRIEGFMDTNEDYGKASPVEEEKLLGELKAICSTDLMGGFKKSGKLWKGGWITDFDSENKYSANLQLAKDNVLKVRAYEGSVIFGESFLWKRIDNVQISCNSIIKGNVK